MASISQADVMQTIRGIYHKGHVELMKKPINLKESTVLVTFISGNKEVDLKKRGLSRTRTAELRGRLKSFAQDWERPEMDAYDTL
mgnify:CR=1 FL=1